MKEKEKYITLTKQQLKASQQETAEYKINLLTKEFIVLPGVFSPKYFVDTEFFAKNLPNIKDLSFLEVGSGTGVIAIIAAIEGASNVVATDINPIAVQNTLKNVHLHSLENKIKVCEGNLFEPVNGMKFDCIFWNVPFMNSTERELTMLERTTFDINDTSKKQFISESKEYLNSNGKLLLGFSSNYGDLENLLQALEKNGYITTLVAETQKEFNGDVIKLELFEAKLIKL